MAKNRQPPLADRDHPLIEPLERIASELNLIRTVLDELRADLQWAMQNGRFIFTRSDVPAEINAPIVPRFYEGDLVEVRDGKTVRKGEIVELDHTIDRAWVAIEPNDEVESVALDSLTKLEQDGEGQDEPSVDVTMPNPGSLF